MTGCCKALLVLAALGAATLLAGCGGGGPPKDVVLVTHDAFAISPSVKRAFEQESGFRLRILKGGDAGEVVTRALLTAGNPEGDVLFGVDNNLVERTLAGDVFEPYAPPELGTVDPALELDRKHRVTPIDHGEVCLNFDRSWYAERGIQPPRSLADLTQPRYRNQLVVENPATSTPGLAFMLATIARFGDRWQEFWRKLRASGVVVVDGWEEAYTVRFSGAAGSHGTRPVVVSYASSPPAEVIFRDPRPKTAPTGVVADSCFRQIELAGILRGAHNEKGARELIDFMLSRRFQRDIPLQMFVFPARRDVPLPREFERFAIVPEHPLELSPTTIDRNRERWVREWTNIVVR